MTREEFYSKEISKDWQDIIDYLVENLSFDAPFANHLVRLYEATNDFNKLREQILAIVETAHAQIRIDELTSKFKVFKNEVGLEDLVEPAQ